MEELPLISRKFIICLLIYTATTVAMLFSLLPDEMVYKLYVFTGGFYVSGNVLSKITGVWK